MVRSSGLLSLAVLTGILAAALYPFGPLPNAVTWIPTGSGLQFAGRGVVLSSGPFADPFSQQTDFSLEIWLKPRFAESVGTILAFYDVQASRQFALRQSISDLELNRQAPDHQEVMEYVDRLFKPAAPVFITIVAHAGRTEIYIDGVFVKALKRFRLTGSDIAGKMVLGTSPREYDGWHGLLWGLAIHARAMTPAEVASRQQSWTSTGAPTSNPAAAQYTFDQRTGNAVRGRPASAPDLRIPDRFILPQQRLLKAPKFDQPMDILLNIAGFIPLGLCLYPYFSGVQRFQLAGIVTILAGAAASLAIELAQSFIPTRNSDLTDVITNTAGTICGVVACRLIAAYRASRYR